MAQDSSQMPWPVRRALAAPHSAYLRMRGEELAAGACSALLRCAKALRAALVAACMIAAMDSASAQSAAPDLTLSDPVAAARSVSDWFKAPAADAASSSFDDAVVILRRLENEATASGLAGSLGLRRSKDRQALAREALAALAADGINSAAIARRALDGIDATPLPAHGFDQRLVSMSEFLSLLPPAEVIDRRARFILRHQATLSPARLKALAADLLNRLDHAPEQAFAAAARPLLPLLRAAYGDTAALKLAARLPSGLPSGEAMELLGQLPVPDKPVCPRPPCTRTSSRRRIA